MKKTAYITFTDDSPMEEINNVSRVVFEWTHVVIYINQSEIVAYLASDVRTLNVESYIDDDDEDELY